LFEKAIMHLGKSIIFLFIIGMISGCGLGNNQMTHSSQPEQTFTPSLAPPTPVLPTETLLPTSTYTATSTPTPVMVFQSDEVTCPILLYHRIEESTSTSSLESRYYTSPSDFKLQMQALKDWGYSTIPISLLVEAIIKGAMLPAKPVVISFDDGYESVYQDAYPIMHAEDFSGVMYLVESYLGAEGFMDIGQIQEMTRNGWEIGSHSMTHPYLSKVHDQVFYEAGGSKTLLSSKIGVDVETFAYPFGDMDGYIATKISEYGYTAAVGLGTQYVHSLKNLFYLSRIEVMNGTDLETFASMLPWSGQP
jgi:peptidoglycan/xylan/chitin deacetylase (PgdA/CDA1 family)